MTQAGGPGRGSSTLTPDLVLTPESLRSNPRTPQLVGAAHSHSLWSVHPLLTGRWPCSPYGHQRGAAWPDLGHCPEPLPHLSPQPSARPVPLIPPLPEVPASLRLYSCPLPTVPSDSALGHSPPGWKGPDPPTSQMEKPRPGGLGICLRSHMEAGAH